MRGIGKGQTITLITPPEVSRLVQAELSVGRGVSFEEQPPLQPGNDEQHLRNVASWLLLNGMRSERTQANMLLCQNTANVWKKRAYRTLKDMNVAALTDGANSTQFSNMLMAWKEDTDSHISNTIPESGTLVQTIRARVDGLKRLEILSSDADLKEIERILSIEVGHTQAVQDEENNASLEGEQVQEQEQEQVVCYYDWGNLIG